MWNKTSRKHAQVKPKIPLPARYAIAIPDFGVSTVILNPAEIFRRWCKLNIGLLRGHVKSRHFTAILLKG